MKIRAKRKARETLFLLDSLENGLAIEIQYDGS